MKRFGVAVIVAASLLVMAGCLISGTFVVIADVGDFCFTAANPLYDYHIDLTTESDWEDHKDKIDFIDAVGFDFWISSSASGDVTFSVYVEEHGAPIRTTITDVKNNATEVFGGFTIASGDDDRHVTYGESLGYIKNIDALRTVVKSGMFNYYGLAEGGSVDNACIDSAKVIVTVSAGN